MDDAIKGDFAVSCAKSLNLDGDIKHSQNNQPIDLYPFEKIKKDKRLKRWCVRKNKSWDFLRSVLAQKRRCASVDLELALNQENGSTRMLDSLVESSLMELGVEDNQGRSVMKNTLFNRLK